MMEGGHSKRAIHPNAGEAGPPRESPGPVDFGAHLCRGHCFFCKTVFGMAPRKGVDMFFPNSCG